MFLYLHEFWRIRFFISKVKVWFLENANFVFKPNFYITKMVQIVCNMCRILVTHICISKIIKKLIFVEFMCILWDILEGKKASF